MLWLSENAYFLEYNDNYQIVWHSIFGRPMLIPTQLAELLRKHYLIMPSFEESLCDFKKLATRKMIATLEEAHILVRSDEAERDAIQRLSLTHDGYDRSQKNKIKSLSLIMSENCQFRCKYCIHFANAKHSQGHAKTMSEKIAKTSIDGYLANLKANGIGEAYINFGGGEPLLNWNTIKVLLPYIKERGRKLNIPIRMSINTNLALLTEEIAEDLIYYNVEIAASLDGTKEGNDAVRLTKDLTGTYNKIMRGFKILADLGHPLDGFAMTVTKDNFFDVDKPIIDWAASMGMKEVRIDIDIVGIVEIPIPSIVEALMEVRRYAKTKDINVIGFWSRPAENMGLIPEVEDVGFCGAERGNSLCVSPSGQVFPCGYSNYKLGGYTKIGSIYKTKAYIGLLQQRDLSRTRPRCGHKYCPILGFCRGGCMITHEAGDESKISRMCELYIRMTHEILRESAEV
ncbi:radical SAM protein [Candidatus Saccharibacteria bacterium]|nr:radical SAM protein [Candidatus Saccharibacteria bacterium]